MGAPTLWPRVASVAPTISAGFGDGLVLVDRASADAYCTDDLAVSLERDAAREHDRPALVAGLDSVERLARLNHRREILHWHVERARGVGLSAGDVDRPEPCAIHTLEGGEAVASVDDCDAHRHPDL